MSFRIEQRIGVPAPSSVIWDVLSDLGRWPEWNPLYPQIAGLLRISQRLTLTEAHPGAPPRVIQPTVVDWVPNAQIIWAFSETGGLIKRLRYIEIETLNDEDTACVVSNGEFFDGLLGPMVAKRNRRRIRAGFAAFNEAIAFRTAKVMAGEVQATGDRG